MDPAFSLFMFAPASLPVAGSDHGVAAGMGFYEPEGWVLRSFKPHDLALQQLGAPMTAKTFSQLMIDLDILASYSRPRVSDDNPNSESQCKTLIYAPSYPGRFTCPQEARNYFQAFFHWYNTHHRHSGSVLLTPDSVHHGLTQKLDAARQHVLDQGYHNDTERSVKGKRNCHAFPSKSGLTNPRTRSNGTTCSAELTQVLSHSY